MGEAKAKKHVFLQQQTREASMQFFARNEKLKKASFSRSPLWALFSTPNHNLALEGPQPITGGASAYTTAEGPFKTSSWKISGGSEPRLFLARTRLRMHSIAHTKNQTSNAARDTTNIRRFFFQPSFEVWGFVWVKHLWSKTETKFRMFVLVKQDGEKKRSKWKGGVMNPRMGIQSGSNFKWGWEEKPTNIRCVHGLP